MTKSKSGEPVRAAVWMILKEDCMLGISSELSHSFRTGEGEIRNQRADVSDLAEENDSTFVQCSESIKQSIVESNQQCR